MLSDMTFCTIPLTIILAQTACGSIFYGTGRVHISYKYTSIDSGLQITYRPENVDKCTGDVRLAKLVYAQAYTYAAAEAARDRTDIVTDGHVMSYSLSGKYYYFTTSDDLHVGRYISIKGEFYNSFGVTIYRDNGTFAISNVENCQLDVTDSSCSNCIGKCSTIFDNDDIWTSYHKSTTTTTSTDTSDSIDPGVIALIVVTIIAVIVIITVVTVIFIRRRKSQDGQPAYTNRSRTTDSRHTGDGKVNTAMEGIQTGSNQNSSQVKSSRDYQTPMTAPNSNVYSSLNTPVHRPPARPPQLPRVMKEENNQDIGYQNTERSANHHKQEQASSPPSQSYSYNYPYDHHPAIRGRPPLPPKGSHPLRRDDSLSMYEGPEASAPAQAADDGEEYDYASEG